MFTYFLKIANLVHHFNKRGSYHILAY